MKKKFKGFSLAELLISLLIISIVLSAAIPAITKKAGQQREFIWRWTELNDVAFTAAGSNQGIILGLDARPLEDSSIVNILDPKNSEVPTKSIKTYDEKNDVDVTGVKYSDAGDKITIVKRLIDSDSTNFVNSHISFFNIASDASSQPEYGGRLTMDAGNIALGIGTLQNLSKDSSTIKNYDNTAIGHFALLRNTEGYRNTAIGKKTLSYNEKGHSNTSLGFGSLFFMGKSVTDDVGNKENTAIGSEAAYNMKEGSDNTIIGSKAALNFQKGTSNTVIGKNAMVSANNVNESGTTLTTNNNTIIGADAFSYFTHGSSNVAIGYKACETTQTGDNNICIGTNAGKGYGITSTDNGLYIGDGDTSNGRLPLIMGHTRHSDGNYDQELIVNAKKVKFYPFNGGNHETPVFEVDAKSGTGYQTTCSGDRCGITSEAKFNLIDTWSDSSDGSIALSLKGGFFNSSSAGYAGKIVQIDAKNPYMASTNTNSWSDILINNKLLIDFPKTTDTYKEVNIGLYEGTKTTSNATGTKINHSTTPLALNDMISLTYYMDGYTDYPPMISMSPRDGIMMNVNGWNSHFVLNTGASGAYIPLDGSGDSSSFIKFGYSYKLASDDKTMITDTYNGFEYKETKNGGFSVDTKGDINLKVSDDNKKMYLNSKHIVFSRITNSFGGSGNSLSGILTDIKSYIDSSLTSYAENDIKIADMKISDIRKKNVLGENTAGLEEINKIEVKNFTYKDDKEKTPHVGVIAQQLQKIFPNAVIKGEDGFFRIRQEDMFYAVINSVKELYQQLQNIITKVTNLEKRIIELEAENKQLKEQNAKFEKRFAALEKKQAALEKQQKAIVRKKQ